MSINLSINQLISFVGFKLFKVNFLVPLTPYSTGHQLYGESVFESVLMINKFYFSNVLCRTIVGIRGKDGVVFGVEKLVLSKLYEYGANKRIIHIDTHIGMVSVWNLLWNQKYQIGELGARTAFLTIDLTSQFP